LNTEVTSIPFFSGAHELYSMVHTSRDRDTQMRSLN
jgi:hypothetical protein